MAYVYDSPGAAVDRGTNTVGTYKYAVRRFKPDTREALRPLLARLAEYDALRLKLEKEGGRIPDVQKITQCLSAPMQIDTPYGAHKASLANQASLRNALFDVGDYDLRLDVRQLANRMPVYYVCRIRRDYWSEYSLVVEDIYSSPGYSMIDERFVRLMDMGHETYYLRLSPFRAPVRAMIDGARTPEWEVDEALGELGRHVFEAAWHDDQRPAMLAATHFGLPTFRNAVELLYLCLSGDLCELRSATDGRMLRFFTEVYPQPAIHALLTRLPGLDGGQIGEMPRDALKRYGQLAKSFSRFLAVEVPWGRNPGPVPLYKLLFANFSRLDALAPVVRREAKAVGAMERLERDAASIIDGMTG